MSISARYGKIRVLSKCTCAIQGEAGNGYRDIQSDIQSAAYCYSIVIGILSRITAYVVPRMKGTPVTRVCCSICSIGERPVSVIKANEEEGTVMGLAAYGQPAYLDKLKQIVTMMPDGSFRMDQSYFRFNRASKMYTYKFLKLFGKERNPGEKIEERHCNIAASLQKFTEDAVVAMARHLYHETKLKKLCLAGGVFLNCVANSKIQEETPFKEIFIQPAAGDSGGAIGATCYVYNSILGNSRNYVMRDAYTGPEFSSSYMKRSLAKEGLHFREFTDPDLFKYIAAKISEDKVVGWFQGRMEIGPRALGNRSILANPCSQEITAILNTRVMRWAESMAERT